MQHPHSYSLPISKKFEVWKGAEKILLSKIVFEISKSVSYTRLRIHENQKRCVQIWKNSLKISSKSHIFYPYCYRLESRTRCSNTYDNSSNITQTIVQGNKKCSLEKKCARDQKMFIRASVAHYVIEWPFMALCGLVWPSTAFLTFNGVLWSYMAIYGLLWLNIDFIGLISSFLAVIDPNSFGLVCSVKKSLYWKL